MDESEIEHGNELKPNERRPTLSYIIANTLVNYGGMTTKEITNHIMKTYPRFSSMNFNLLNKTVGSDISRNKYYYKKSKDGNACIWAVLPKYKSYLEHVSPSAYSRDRRLLKKLKHVDKVEQKKSSKLISVNNETANLELKTDVSEEHDESAMNTDEILIRELKDLEREDIQKILDDLHNEEAKYNSSEMGVYKQEPQDVQIENSAEYNMNQSCGGHFMDMFETFTNNDGATLKGVESSILQETKYVESLSTNSIVPTNATISVKHMIDGQEESVAVCPMCNLSLFNNEELGKHVIFQHKNQSNQLNDVLTSAFTTFEKVRPQAPINIYLVTGNQNVYMTAEKDPDNKLILKTDS